ncbi:MAG: hypothetical protein WBB37_08235 [bacterium]
MMKKIHLMVVIALIIFGACSKKDDQNKTLNQKSIEKVAMIAAMFEIDNDKAIEMLRKEDFSTEFYKEMIYKISLDEKATETFVLMKKTYKEQYQE